MGTIMIRLLLIMLSLCSGTAYSAQASMPILPEITIKQNMEGVLNPLKPVEEKKLSPRERRKKRKTKITETVPQDAIQQKVDKILDQSLDDEQANIEFNFENADLQNVVDYISELFSVSFIPDDAIKPMLSGGKGVAGNKLSFRTEKPMTKRAVWSLFTTFLDMAGLAVAETPESFIYRITSAPATNKLPLQAFIGTSPDLLPDNDNHIRYVYFLNNATVDTIKPIIDQLRSTTSTFSAFVPLRALILTDKAYNIKALMKIVLELDKASMPETMSVLKLRFAAAEDVKKLFDELTKSDDQRGMVARIFGAKKQTESFFFPENTRLISEPRSNSLILIGTQDTINKIENFVAKIDTQLTEEISPLYIYELQHTDATSMAEILNKVTQFGIGTVVGQAGGVRDGEKYFKPITFTPEKSGNRLIVKGDYEDYIKAKDIIKQLDVAQPECAIEVLVVDINLNKTKVLGTQWRNKSPGSIAKNVNFQTSGLIRTGIGAQPVVDPTTGSIMANLISLATGNEPGSTLLSLGPDGNIWAIFKALSTKVDARIVSNPFLITSNKYKATVALGETRRVNVGTVVSGGNQLASQDDLSANLEVIITPQINHDGVIIMDISIEEDAFTNASNPSDATRTTKHIETKAALANREILALGGLIRTTIDETETKVPILGDIPLIGWFFKNRQKIITKSNLLVFIAPQIVQPRLSGGANNYTLRKAEYSRDTLRVMDDKISQRDPIHRWFFTGEPSSIELDDFMSRQSHPKPEDTTASEYYPNRTTHKKPVYKPGQLSKVNDSEEKIKQEPIIREEKKPAEPTEHTLRRHHHKRSLSAMIEAQPTAGAA